MHTIDKKNMKKKIEIVKIETFTVVDYYQINFFFRSHRMSNEILFDMKK